MAVTQISRIQHRRGLQQDLPQLASAEIGWSIDTRKLYIGNGTLDEGAPTEGITEILTERSLANLTSFIGTYTFVGNVAGYNAQTGSSYLNPTVRSLQSKLDDFVNIRDFGAIGDGLTDDTSAINRALTQIYKTGVNETQPLTRRTIYFPGGRYKITDTLAIPSYATLVGEGIENTVITADLPDKSLANIVDSKFQVGANIGASGATIPRNIDIRNMKFFNSNTQIQNQLVTIDSAVDVRFVESGFVSNTTTVGNLVHILSTVSSTKGVTFDNCYFEGGGNGISILGDLVTTVRIYNSEFESIANAGVLFGKSNNTVLLGNFYSNVGVGSLSDNAVSFMIFGEKYGITTTNLFEGLYLGNLQQSHAESILLSSTPQVVANLQQLNLFQSPITATDVIYQISNSSSKRFGTMTITSDTSSTSFTDSYQEVGNSFNANLFANSTHLIGSVASGTGVLNYSVKKFI